MRSLARASTVISANSLFWRFAVLGLLVLVLFVLSLAVGAVAIPWTKVVTGLCGGLPPGDPDRLLLLEFRLPRALTALIAGGALPVAGLVMQSWFRNPLAGPDLLGVHTGAGVGVALALLGASSGFLPMAGRIGVLPAAVAGAAASLILIMVLSSRVHDRLIFLILGLLFNFAAGSLVTVLSQASEARDVQSLLLWGFGSFGGVELGRLPFLAIPVALALLFLWMQHRKLDAMLLGDDAALSLGVSLRRLRPWIFLATALLSGSVTAFCGPITFLALVVPHVARWILGTGRHGTLLPASCLVGACVALAAGLLSETVGGGRILPLNAVLSLTGAPVAFWIVWRLRV